MSYGEAVEPQELSDFCSDLIYHFRLTDLSSDLLVSRTQSSLTSVVEILSIVFVAPELLVVVVGVIISRHVVASIISSTASVATIASLSILSISIIVGLLLSISVALVIVLLVEVLVLPAWWWSLVISNSLVVASSGLCLLVELNWLEALTSLPFIQIPSLSFGNQVISSAFKESCPPAVRRVASLVSSRLTLLGLLLLVVLRLLVLLITLGVLRVFILTL